MVLPGLAAALRRGEPEPDRGKRAAALVPARDRGRSATPGRCCGIVAADHGPPGAGAGHRDRARPSRPSRASTSPPRPASSAPRSPPSSSGARPTPTSAGSSRRPASPPFSTGGLAARARRAGLAARGRHRLDAGRFSARAVGRGVDALGPDRASILKRYLRARACRSACTAPRTSCCMLDPLPAGWQIVPPAMAGARRFLARLDFFLLQPERIPARPPRALLEARCGRPRRPAGTRLPRTARRRPGLPHARADGADRPLPACRAGLLRPLPRGPGQGTRALYAGRPRAALPFLEPAQAPRPATVGADRRRIAFYPTNGIGLGHVARLLAVAKRLGPAHEPVFFTPCHALAVIENA